MQIIPQNSEIRSSLKIIFRAAVIFLLVFGGMVIAVFGLRYLVGLTDKGMKILLIISLISGVYFAVKYLVSGNKNTR